MVIDYSKFDNLEDSDDEQAPATVGKPAGGAGVVGSSSSKVAVKMDNTRKAVGSVWNTSNYHWEEKNLDKFGKETLKKLLQTEMSEEINYGDINLTVASKPSVETIDGDTWSHIRKGKSVCGFNFEIKIKYEGTVQSSGRTDSFAVTSEFDFMVDDETDIPLSWTRGSELPFRKSMESTIRSHLSSRLQAFADELQRLAMEKAQGVQGGKSAPAIQVGEHNKSGKKV